MSKLEKVTPNKEEKLNIIPLVWDSADEIPTIYANQLFITHRGGEFYLIFGEVEQVMHTEAPKELHVQPKAKIVVAPHHMGPIANVIRENWKRFVESIELADEEIEKDKGK